MHAMKPRWLVIALLLLLSVNIPSQASAVTFHNAQAVSSTKPVYAKVGSVLYIKMPTTAKGNYFTLTLLSKKGTKYGSAIKLKPGSVAVIDLVKSGVKEPITSITWVTFTSKGKKLKSQSSLLTKLGRYKVPAAPTPTPSATPTPSSSSSASPKASGSSSPKPSSSASPKSSGTATPKASSSANPNGSATSAPGPRPTTSTGPTQGATQTPKPVSSPTPSPTPSPTVAPLVNPPSPQPSIPTISPTPILASPIPQPTFVVPRPYPTYLLPPSAQPTPSPTQTRL